MNKEMKSFFLIFVLCLIPFGLYFFTSSFVDGDSYFYLSSVCLGSSVTEQELLTGFVTHLLPCNPLFLKLFLFVIYFLTCCVLFLIVRTQTNQTKYLPYLIAGSLLFFEFAKLENDVLGYLFGFIAIYFLLKKKFLYSIPFFVLGFCFWFGVAYWIALTPLFFIPFAPIILLTIFFYEKFVWFMGATDPILEHTNWLGFLNYGFILPFFYLGLLTRTPKKIVASFLVLVLINIFVSKLWVLALPFGLIIANNGLNELLKNKKLKDFVVKFVVISGIVMSFFLMQFILIQPFTISDEELIKKGVDLACKENDCWIENDFSVGHLIHFFGGKTKQYSSVSLFEYKGVVIDIKFTQTPVECIQVSESTYFKLLKCTQ